MGFDVERFKDEVRKELICPICNGVLENPVGMAACAHIFCQACILESLAKKQECPIDNCVLKEEDLRIVHCALVSKLLIKCDYALNGCNEFVRVDELYAHLKKCEHNPWIEELNRYKEMKQNVDQLKIEFKLLGDNLKRDVVKLKQGLEEEKKKNQMIKSMFFAANYRGQKDLNQLQQEYDLKLNKVLDELETLGIIQQKDKGQNEGSDTETATTSANSSVVPNVTRNAIDNTDQQCVKVEKENEMDEFKRCVRKILNKLKSTNMDSLAGDFIKLKIDNQLKMQEAVELILEAATKKRNSRNYARFFQRLVAKLHTVDQIMEGVTKSNSAQFRSLFLDKVEQEFKEFVLEGKTKEEYQNPNEEEQQKCNVVRKEDEDVQLDEEDRQKSQRVNMMRFIGELFKVKILTGRIIYNCIEKLLNPYSEVTLECLCALLNTIGAKFERTPLNSRDRVRCYSLEMVVKKMKQIANKTDEQSASIGRGVRLMLLDVINLRKNGWRTISSTNDSEEDSNADDVRSKPNKATAARKIYKTKSVSKQRKPL